MAKRESQGLQIALILLVMFSVLLCITTYIFWNQSQKAHKELTSLRADKAEADKQRNDKITENQRLKQILGLAQDEPLETVETEYTSDMQLFATAFPEENRNYRELAKYLAQTIQDRNQLLDQAQTLEKKLKSELVQAREESRLKIAAAEQGQQAASNDLAKLKSDFQTEMDQVNQQRNKLQQSYEDATKKLADQRAQLTAKITGLEIDLDELQRQNRTLQNELQGLRTESFDRPDGRITWVNQRTRTVYLDLGRADALRPQITFSVYDVDENNLARAERKGSIEVTQILEERMSEARILDDNPSNPVVAGDVVFSPVWEAGHPIRFALAGFMDVNDDDVSDRKLVKNLIAVNGGLIDAEVDDEGQRSGDVTIETRYLVIGERPTEGTTNALLIQEFSALIKDAERFGVTIITLDRLLADMGYRPTSRTIRLGEDARGEDFRPGGGVRNQQFRPRSRPER